jgi:hypothetical protein
VSTCQPRGPHLMERPRPLILQKSSKEKEEAEAQEGATTTIGSVLEERSGSLKFTSRCRQESAVEEKEIWAIRSCTDSRQPSDPEKVAQSLISGRVHRQRAAEMDGGDTS